jgi:hypothetical protein
MGGTPTDRVLGFKTILLPRGLSGFDSIIMALGNTEGAPDVFDLLTDEKNTIACSGNCVWPIGRPFELPINFSDSW